MDDIKLHIDNMEVKGDRGMTILEAAGISALSDAKPLEYNRYMVQIAKILVKRALLACKVSLASIQ